MLVGFSSCQKSRVCQYTSTYSDGLPNTLETHPTLDNTFDPDCLGFVGTSEDGGVTTTTTCVVVDT